MQGDEIFALVVAGLFLIGGVLTCVFARPLVRGVARGQRAVFGRLGEESARKARPWNYFLVGGFSCFLGVVVLLVALLKLK